ncbi:MAG TPA: phage tail protein [Polyangiaceae bacterium]|nr:phage tail protein [Polyangiaceae bacterium]
MDVNGVPYLALLERFELLPAGAGFSWNTADRHVCLARADAPRLPARDLIAQKRPAPPCAVDPLEQIARIGPATGGRASGRWIEVTLDAGLPSERREPLRVAYRVTTDAQGRELEQIPADAEDAVLTPPGNQTYRDLAFGAGWLALPSSDGTAAALQVCDTRQRRVMATALPALPRRAAVAAGGRVWVLAADRLLSVAGGPLPQPFSPEEGAFRPERDNPLPLAVVATFALPPGLAGVALCVAFEHVWVLCEAAASEQVLLRLGASGAFTRLVLPAGLPWFADFAPIGDAFAFLAWPAASDPPRRDAWLAQPELAPEPRLVARAGRHPLHPLESPRFTTPSPSGPRYASDRGPSLLALLPQPHFVAQASGELPRALDSGELGCVWHRLVLEGTIPPGCALRIAARTSELPFTGPGEGWVEQPAPTWIPQSDLPWHAGLAPSVPQTSGHFELLLQRTRGNVRRLTGRFLELRVTLAGDGRHSPSIAAIRVHYRRFSYQEHHLPTVYRQQESYDPASTLANGADVRERFFAALEGVLTPIEGRIALSEWLVDPLSAPRSLLPQIASFAGIALDPSWPEARNRRLLAESGRLHRMRGTPAGVRLALDIATDGAVARGQIVIVENFRLRRTMATLLGVRIDDRDHPLSLGTMPEGNAIVGDSLILAEASARAFLALLDERGGSDAAAVARFFDSYAHQVSVLLHGAARALGAAVERALARFAPAHVRYRIIATDTPFVLGLSPLLAVDTALEPEPPAEAVTLGATLLGRGDLVQNGVAFIPSAAPE